MTLKEELEAIERQKFEALDWNKPNNQLSGETGYSLVKIALWRKRLNKERAVLKRDYFEGLDWSKSNMELSRETGVLPNMIGLWRYRLGKPKVTKWLPDCMGWDWSKSDTDLAVEHHTNPSTVRGLRIKINAPKAPPRAPSTYVRAVHVPTPNLRKRINWESLDWSKNDMTLAKEVFRSREAVRQNRARLGKPKSAFKHRYGKFIRFAERFKGRSELDYKEAFAAEPLTRGVFRDYCQHLGIVAVEPAPHNQLGFGGSRRIHPWEKINFELPSILLEKIWRTPTNTVATWRSRHVLPPPKFRCLKGRVPEQHKALVEAEKRKAEDYFNLPTCT